MELEERIDDARDEGLSADQIRAAVDLILSQDGVTALPGDMIRRDQLERPFAPRGYVAAWVLQPRSIFEDNENDRDEGGRRLRLLATLGY
jgi:hypothetical protein